MKVFLVKLQAQMPGLPLGFCWFTNWVVHRRAGKDEEARYSRWGSGRFTQRGNLSASFILAAGRRISGPPARILNVYIKA